MALRTSATNAEDVAAGFMRFREPLPEHATEITGLIADLYGISTSLNALEELTRSADFRYRRNVPLVRPDLELVRASLKYTLEDIVDFFGNIDPRRPATREIYKRTWFELSTFFRREINYSLATRLRKYKLFLRELEDFTAEYVWFWLVGFGVVADSLLWVAIFLTEGLCLISVRELKLCWKSKTIDWRYESVD